MESGSGREKTMERKNRKSGSTIFYLTLTPVQQGTRRKGTCFFCFLLVLFPYVPVRAIETLNPNHSCSDLIEMLNDTITFSIIKLQNIFLMQHFNNLESIILLLLHE